jgi:hypothetical protein
MRRHSFIDTPRLRTARTCKPSRITPSGCDGAWGASMKPRGERERCEAILAEGHETKPYYRRLTILTEHVGQSETSAPEMLRRRIPPVIDGSGTAWETVGIQTWVTLYNPKHGYAVVDGETVSKLAECRAELVRP